MSILQFMSAREGSWDWLFSLHDMQLLPRDEVSEQPQVHGEKFRNKLSYLLWFLVYIKCCSQSSTLWPFHAFSLLSGFYLLNNFFFFSHVCSPSLCFSPTLVSSLISESRFYWSAWIEYHSLSVKKFDNWIPHLRLMLEVYINSSGWIWYSFLYKNIHQWYESHFDLILQNSMWYLLHR